MRRDRSRGRLAPLASAFNKGVENGHEDQRQQGRRDHAAEDGRAERLPAGRACPACEHQRKHAENEGEGGHQDRPQTQPSRLHRRLDDRQALLATPFGEFNDQDRVLRREADQHDEADLRIDVDLHPADIDRAQRARPAQEARTTAP